MHIRIRNNEVLLQQQSETVIVAPEIRGELFAVFDLIDIWYYGTNILIYF